MPLSDLIERARQGDADAIARLITRSLSAQGGVANAHWQGAQLYIALEGDEPLDQGATVPVIRRGLRRLQLTCDVDRVYVTSRQVGQPSPQWQEQFWLRGSGDPANLNLPIPADAADKDAAPGGPSSSPGDLPGDDAIGSDNSAALLSDHALLALAQLGPLFGYLVFLTNGVVGFPFVWWGSTFLLPWRIVPPLVLLLTRGQTSAFVSQQSKRAINFQLSMVVYWIVTIALMFVLIGFILAIPLALLEFICVIIAAVKSSEGKAFRYPLAIPFVK